MSRPRFLLAVPFALVAAVAVAAEPSQHANVRWDKQGANGADFSSDNESCSARATRMEPTPQADQAPGGVAVPNSRMEQPPRVWTHPVAEKAYMDCMAERGWRLVPR